MTDKSYNGQRKRTLEAEENEAYDQSEYASAEEDKLQDTTPTTTTVEVNFRLDHNGRTVPSVINDSDTNESAFALDYSTRATSSHFIIVPQQQEQLEQSSIDESHIQSDLQNSPTTAIHDDLLLDCDIADSCLMPRTFWIDYTMQPRCNLEQIAYDILQYYCPPTRLSTTPTSGASCGAEWWVQIRPSPELTSRYTASEYVKKENLNNSNAETNDNMDNVDNDNGNSNSNNIDNNGISFHWDKDEELRILCDGTVYIHPHLSTVTYLTDGNGEYSIPTMIIENCRIHNLTGEWVDRQDDDAPTTAFISWPYKGKHLCFDGRFLHAAPSNLLLGLEQECAEKSIEDDTTIDPIKRNRRKRRYTFLVNIWMHHKPFDVHPFPSSMIDKMSGSALRSQEKIHFELETNDTNSISDVTSVIVKSDDTIEVLCTDTTTSTSTPTPTKSTLISKTERIKQFIWPMGDHNSNESIHASIPLSTVQSRLKCGGNIRISWNPSETQSSIGLLLEKGASSFHDQVAKQNEIDSNGSCD